MNILIFILSILTTFSASSYADELDNAAQVARESRGMTYVGSEGLSQMQANAEKFAILGTTCSNKRAKNQIKACFLLGVLSLESHQESQAKMGRSHGKLDITHLEMACRAKYPQACTYLATAYDEGGQGNSVEPTLQKGCKNGDKTSCDRLKELMDAVEELTKQQSQSVVEGAWSDALLRGGGAGTIKPQHWADRSWRSMKAMNGYALFNYPITSKFFISKYKIAFKVSKLQATYSEGHPFSDILVYPECLKFQKEEKWKNELGYEMNVLIYDVEKCAQ